MLTVEEAHRRIVAPLTPLGGEWVALPEAAGRVLGAPLYARRTQPPADLSAMDGYAVRAGDVATGSLLSQTGEIAAGQDPGPPLEPGCARRIYTGAALPEGADAVLIQENATPAGDRAIRANQQISPGDHVRRRGLDFAADTRLIDTGTRLSPRHIALAAAAGHAWLPVVRRPRVALLATGDELVRPGDPVPPGAIVDAVTPGLSALLTQAGAHVTALGVARDTADHLAGHVADLAAADLAVTIGGASVGARDLIRRVLGDAGMDLDFWKIAMRPGKPLLHGTLSGTPLIGLPGNPVSAHVCGLLYAVPAVERLAGGSGDLPRPTRAIAAVDLPAGGTRQDYQRATLDTPNDGPPHVTPLPVQDSAMLSTLARADALLVRPAHAPASPAGTSVPVLPLSS